LRKALVDDVLGGSEGSSLQVRCMYSASWTCPDLPAYDPEYAPCWEAARLAQSKEGLPQEVTPCDNSRGWFTLGDPRVQPVDLVDRTHRWANYFAEIRSSLGAGGDAAVSTFDYVTAPLDDVSTPAANEAMHSVPAVRVRPPTVPQDVLAAGGIMDGGLKQICASTLGGWSLVVEQDRMDAAPAISTCLLPSHLQHMDQDRFLQPNAAARVLINDGNGPAGDGNPYIFDVCLDSAGSPGSNGGMGLSSTPGGRYCYASKREGGQCGISAVNAPPGVQVRAYAGWGDDDWGSEPNAFDDRRCPNQNAFTPSNGRRSCTWMPYQVSAAHLMRLCSPTLRKI
jgi:hypothetical protein